MNAMKNNYLNFNTEAVHDLLSLGVMVHRLNPADIPFFKAN